jgi:lipoate-protein ligase A
VSCRLIPYAKSDPLWNMALDEAVFDAFIAGHAPPTLRFYGWVGKCVTIGRLQPPSSVPEGWGTSVIRRPTGGRAVLHRDDLTFSIVVDTNTLGSPIRESYRRIGHAVCAALREIGIDAEMCRNTTPPKSVRGIGDCFDLTLEYELSVAGKKVLGSAQVRRSGAVLQQNTLALPGRYMDSGRDDLIEAITCSMASEFGIEIVARDLTPAELQNARSIADNKNVIECRNPTH